MITAIIQARMSSTRLPGKVLLPLGDTTILGWTVRRVREAKNISEIVVATSDRQDDDMIEKHCAELGAKIFRGNLNDVLDRYYSAAKQFAAQTVCRVTADCPLVDPEVIDRVVREYERRGCDYASTGRSASTFPDGLDVELFSFNALETAWKEAKLPSEREHVTPYVWNHPERFEIVEIKNDTDLSAIRLTIDEPRDYELLKRVVADAGDLSMRGIVKYLSEHPEVAALNAPIVRDAGYLKSLAEDTKG